MEDFVEEFDDGKVQFGFARVTDPNSNLPKFVLIGWAGEGIPERVKGYFNSNFSTISRHFHGYHVQITARSQDDLSVPAILAKVEGASGAKYSGAINSSTVRTRPVYAVSSTGASEDDWGDDAPPVVESKVTKVQSSYRPTKVDIESIKSSAPKSSPHSYTPAEPVRGSYQPVGKVDIAAIRAQAKDNKFNPKPSPLQSSYQPVGKVDIAALRAQASKKPSSFASEPKITHTPATSTTKSSNDEDEYKPTSVHDRMRAFGGSAVSSSADDDEDEAPKSLKDRMKSYQGNAERMTELPKHKTNNAVANRFSAASTPGTAPSLPKTSFGSTPKSSTGPSRDFASAGGKTPAQIWAEKHAKNSGSHVAAPRAPEPVQHEQSESPSIASLRSNFASTAVSEPEQEEEEEEEPTTDVSDLKSKFAQRFAVSSPSAAPQSKEATPEPPAPSLPERSLPPPLPSTERPVPSAPSPEPEVSAPPPLPTVERSLPPPLPTAGRALPPPFVPSAAPEPASEPEEEEEEDTPPPALPSRDVAPGPEAVPDSDAAGLPTSAIVLYTYAKDDENELGLEEDELITVIEFTDAEWWLGVNAQGEKGLFPAEYVSLQSSSNKPASGAGTIAVSLYEYEAVEPNELSFPEGALITEIEFDDEDWWSGVYNNQRNLFPSNYVELQK